MLPAGRRALLGIFLSALALRVVLMSSRGDFLEFDETYYLLIARSLLAGEGYRMNGLPQVAFPPLPAFMYALLGLATADLARAGRIASAVLSAALVFPAAALARRAFGPSEALLTASFVAVMPSLTTFAPIARPYAESLYFGPEPLYLIVVTSAGLFLARAATTGRLGDAAACGVLAGLAYLTRNEAIVFALAAAAVLLLAPRRRVAGAAAALGAAALVGLPYAVYLHHVTGEWSVSGKAASAVLIRESVSRKVLQDDPAAFEQVHYALDDSRRSMRSTYWGFYPRGSAPRDGGHRLLELSAADVRRNVRIYVTRLLPALLHWALWPFALAGAGAVLLRVRRDGVRAAATLPVLALGALLAPSAAVCLLLFVEPRHHLYLVPLLASLAAHGLVRAAGLLPPARRAAAWGMAAALSGLLLWTTLSQLAELRRHDGARRQLSSIRMLGEVLDEALADDEPVMSWNPAVAYYAGRPWRVMPSERFNRTASYARRQGAGAIVYETAVHGPPPGSDESVPFTVVRLEEGDPDQIEAGGLSLSFVREDAIHRLLRLEVQGRAPVGLAASSEDGETERR